MPISLNQQIEEVERELEMRRKVYPTSKGASRAQKDYQVQRMQAVLRTLQWLKANEPLIRGMMEKTQEQAHEGQED
jgi:hypothetical protein